MKIHIADNPAFCYGVERAYDLAKEQKGSRVFTWGPLIHNPQIVRELENLGIVAVKSLNDLKIGDTVILRAHGVSDKTKSELEKNGIKIIDGTCPFVTKAHLIARNFVKNGYKLVIIGDKEHPEIRGIYEDFPEAIVIKNVNDVVKTLQCNDFTGKLGIICQTTIKIKEVEEIIKEIKKINSNLVFENTICNATHTKQNSARKLAEKVDCMLVVGGKNSNNTKMLQQICSRFCPSYLVSSVDEVRTEWFEGVENVGITGGASTPLWLIEEVEERLAEL